MKVEEAMFFILPGPTKKMLQGEAVIAGVLETAGLASEAACGA